MHEPRASDPSSHVPIGESGGATPHAGEREPSGGGKPAGAATTPPLHRGDEAPPGTPGSGETICRRCGGGGTLAGGTACPDCGGSGKTVAAIGGA